MKPIIAKPAIFVIALAFFLTTSLQAQSKRRSTNSTSATANVTPSIDFSDPFSETRVRLAFDSEPAPRGAAPASNLVPISQLRIPSKAIKEFERGQKALKSGDNLASAEHFQKALEIYPDFLQAHNSLGLRYVQRGEFEKALTEHQLALSLDPRNSQTHEDLALVLVSLNRAPEAETEARQALELNPQSVCARYVLGRALIAQRRFSSEAMENLRQSENAFPNASLVLAQIHFSAGRTEETVTELRQYLRAPADPDNKRKAECWVAQLTGQSQSAGCPAGITRPSFH
jgi:tetratricopeptide (TPR) repeat protein